MLNALIPHVMRLRARFPRAYSTLVALARRFMARRLGVYPRALAGEVTAAASVIRSSQWNMTAGRGLAHERLEARFAEFVGAGHAVAVNTGGMALQMSMRALGLKHGDEVLMQVDTCSAAALAAIAAGCTPLFADISPRTLMLDPTDVERCIGTRTRAIVATHMWGNPEDLAALERIAYERGLVLLEDTCLALGARAKGRAAGSTGRVGVFSFGCLKPIQGGEGGMIVTNDEALARELRAMRHWGDRTLEFGVRDTTLPAWNGRMSEIVAAVVHEQLKGYPAHLAALRDSVHQFHESIAPIEGLRLMLGDGESIDDCAFTQVVLELDSRALGTSKDALKQSLAAGGVPVWHANFEPITSLSLFRTDAWSEWLPCADGARTRANYRRVFTNAHRTYESTGIGLGKMNFLSRQNLKHLVSQVQRACAQRPA